MQDKFQSVSEARNNIQKKLPPLTGTRTVAIREALDQVLAQDILSPIDVPAHINSAMDGYAVRSADLNTTSTSLSLQVISTAYAGKPLDLAIPAGCCVRIMTGAVVPPDCDTVVVQENTTLQDQAGKSTITFDPSKVKPGENVRQKGEDLAQGQAALRGGKVLRPADLGLMASLGVAEVQIKRKLRVAFFSTGDELRSLGQALDEGCVYDSNRYTLYGMLRRLRFVDVIDMGVVKDSPQSLEAAMLEAANQADVIITSGGVSVGEADFTKQVMAKLGQVEFWKIAMRPGRPMAFGTINKPQGQGSAVLFGLPGNPVAVMVTFYAFVRDALHFMVGAETKPLPTIKAKLEQEARKKPGRTEYQRVRLIYKDQEWTASLTGAQGSGILRSMSESDGLMVLSHDQGTVPAGGYVDVLPFEGLL
ncbi:MAG: molybdopterin molybdotransferase MoeA [Limnobacter sp.]|nr:molybdopterin molybdotransferase MoeA [Limnobacter sp.]